MEDVTPKTYTFFGEKSGPHIVIFGCIHGDETCGYNAISKLINQIEANKISISSGKLTLVPICNKKAWIEQKRYIDKNMNCTFHDNNHENHYESLISIGLMDILKEADYLLDLHSNDADGPPFCFQDYNDPSTIKLVNATGIENIVQGWLEIPEHDGKGEPVPYVKQYKGTGVVVECGKNGTAESDTFAYSVIINTLCNLKLIDINKPLSINNNIAIVNKIYFKDKEDYSFTQEWVNFDFIPKGTVIAATNKGNKIVAENDSIILMPNPSPTHGLAYFYLAQKV